MKYERLPLCVDIADKNRVLVEHERLLILLRDKTASFSLKTLDMGSLFFRKRNDYTSSGRKVSESFDENRRFFLVGFTEYLFYMQGSDLSKLLFYYTIKIFIDWVDDQKKILDFSQKESVLEAYQRYSKYLVNRTLLNDTAERHLSAHTAKNYQRNAAKIIAYVFDCHEIDILVKAPQIKSRRYDVPVLPVAQEEHQRTYATLTKVFLEIYRIVVKGGNFPAHLRSIDEENFYFYSNFHHRVAKPNVQFDIQGYLSKYATIPSLEKILSDFDADKGGENRKRVRENRNQVIRKLEQLNQDKHHIGRQRLAAYGLVIGMMLFIAQTGVNLDTVQQLELDTMQVSPSSQGRRFSGTKSRAGGKAVYPEFGVKFEPIFRKILELRQWYVRDRACGLVFPTRNDAQQLVPIGNSKIQLIKNFLLRIFPEFVWITPQQWRKHVSSQYVELSDGDLLLEAEKMGHSLDIARKNYSRTSFKDAGQQISQFFKELRNVAVAKTREAEHIAVMTIDNTTADKSPNHYASPVGLCQTQSMQPVRAFGFSVSAPEPNCRQFEHCLFCQHYAVHADDEDIRKLLSLKISLIYVKQHATDLDKWERHFGVILHRIDEVINELANTYEKVPERITQIWEEVESGDLDPYWRSHFELLVDLGWLS